MTAAGSADPLGIVSKGVGSQTSFPRINTHGVKKCKIAALSSNFFLQKQAVMKVTAAAVEGEWLLRQCSQAHKGHLLCQPGSSPATDMLLEEAFLLT